MTHADLVTAAKKWLRNKGCSVVLSELSTAAYETPDAIGFRSTYSVLVECKASRSDFARDAKKHFRRWPQNGMGTFRFYLCPEGLLSPSDLPERWGLLWIKPNGRISQIIGPKGNIWSGQTQFAFERSMHAEYVLLVSALRRVQEHGGDAVGGNG